MNVTSETTEDILPYRAENIFSKLHSSLLLPNDATYRAEGTLFNFRHL